MTVDGIRSAASITPERRDLALVARREPEPAPPPKPRPAGLGREVDERA